MGETFQLIMDFATPIVALLYIFVSVYIFKQQDKEIKSLKSQVNHLQETKVTITKNPRCNK